MSTNDSQVLQKKETKYNQLSQQQIKAEQNKANAEAKGQSQTQQQGSTAPGTTGGEQTSKPQGSASQNNSQIEGANTNGGQTDRESNAAGAAAATGGQDKSAANNQSTHSIQKDQQNNSQSQEQSEVNQGGSDYDRSRLKKKSSVGNLQQPASTQNQINSNRGGNGDGDFERTSQNGSRMLQFNRSIALDALRPDENGNQKVQEFYVAKQGRVQVQRNAEKLGNRIALLRQEELNLLKKIEETRKQALEIYYLKLKKEAKSNKQNEEMVKAEREKEERKKVAEEQFRQKKENEKKLKNMQSTYEIEKKQQAEIIKRESERIQGLIEKNKRVRLDKIITQKQEIKKTQEMGKNKIFEFIMEKREKYRSEVDLNKRMEERKRQEKQYEIKKMEAYESELIQRLKQTQNISQHAFDELESALLLSAQQFKDRFLKNQEGNNQAQQPQDFDHEMSGGDHQNSQQDSRNKQQSIGGGGVTNNNNQAAEEIQV